MTVEELKKIESEAKEFAQKLQNANKREISTFVTADTEATRVMVVLTMGHGHRPLDIDNAKYIFNKFKKKVRPLIGLRARKDKSGEWMIIATMSISPIFCRVEDINNLAEMGKVIVDLAENRLTEPDVLDSLNADCEPWYHVDDAEVKWNVPAEQMEGEDEEAGESQEDMAEKPDE